MMCRKGVPLPQEGVKKRNRRTMMDRNGRFQNSSLRLLCLFVANNFVAYLLSIFHTPFQSVGG